MISVRRRGSARLAAAVLASGLIAAGAVATAAPAVADDAVPFEGGVTATLNGLQESATAVITHKDGKKQKVGAGLFGLTVNGGGSLQTYCIDIANPTQSKAQYEERAWDQTSLHNNADAGKIRWILQNSYPQVNDLSALASKAGAQNLTKELAAAGTQVAIWRFSDKANVEAQNPEAEKLADYLEQNAQSLEEPKASLSLTPPAVSGKPGDRLGPIGVQTNADSVTVEPGAASADVKIVDKNGQPVTSASNGSELFFDVPTGTEPGSTSMSVKATTKVEVGRAFASKSKSQTQILAGSSESTVTATATAEWAKAGPIPAVSAKENCAKGGVDITATNEGDEPFTFDLAGESHSVEAGKSETITIPVKEDQAYKFTIKGPNGFEKTFEGVLDCETTGTENGPVPSSEPSPATAGGSGDEVGGDTPAETPGGDLAETGGSSATPMIAGVALALVLAGGATVFFLRKKKAVAGE
ncbi:Cys-Gln thioester bond-forming surface protein [Streptomyces zingiberis]|uniref:Cys-Gln thioester bond-forming surface protein n=1 Tax=Streptomyces zingiberis TaxID=2053010 RepID=A0ABX1C654_9ACTN|nr:Cys-Gln thioester bond-forming surface protein [Streptomyces zingiberis]NJQ03397.1 Cys-Gln thioester bond-forming surface protein [Streptomyces zingiberis]